MLYALDNWETFIITINMKYLEVVTKLLIIPGRDNFYL